MKRIALAIALALATSSAAYADGEPSHDRYESYSHSHWHGEFHGRWTPLAQGYSASAGRQFINVGRDRSRFRKIRIEGTRGETMVIKVAVLYLDKTEQAVELDDALPAGQGHVIQLNSTRPISQIVVYTDRGSHGRYSVFGA